MISDIDKQSEKLCNNLLKDILEISKLDNSVSFFRKDLPRMTIWLLIISSYLKGNRINIEDISRAVAPSSKISKPSLRLILENAKHKGFIKFTNNKTDRRSLVVEPEEITIREFKLWSKNFF
jgi:hypothetical protein